MKKVMVTFILAAIMVLWLTPVAGAQGDSRTPADIYLESYSSQMKKMMPRTLHEERARLYREVYEVCDSHHNCQMVTSSEVPMWGEAGRWQFMTHGTLIA